MDTFAFARCALNISVAGALLAGCGGSQLPAATSSSAATPFLFTHHMTFRYTGKKQTFEVPRGVTRIRVIADGANGGGIVSAPGGRVAAVIPVTPLQTLAIYVGGNPTSSEGGFNGGGAGGLGRTSGYLQAFGGGGASDVRQGGDALKDRIVVAAGGGGEGFVPQVDRGEIGFGGKGGARSGASGKNGCCKRARNGGDGGTGATQNQGGLGGGGAGPSGAGGQLGDGGIGGTCRSTKYRCGYGGGGGGGGGGGYYGGGGGGAGVFFGSSGTGGGGGGGGGSSYVESTATNVHMWRGWNSSGGIIVFSW